MTRYLIWRGGPMYLTLIDRGLAGEMESAGLSPRVHRTR
jgi:hypothetical protein